MSAPPNPQAPQDPSAPVHRFWDSQPVPHTNADFARSIQQMGEFETKEEKLARIPRDPYPLPPGYEWFHVNIDNDAEMQKVYNLLQDHYVEDTEGMFRFRYSIPFLRWALKPPGYLPQWHIGVRAQATGTYVGFISAVPSSVRCGERELKMVEINFLCVHKKLRAKRLAPVLIMEITRRVNLEGIFQAIYTAGVEIPTPICKARYYHRSLDPKKLIAVNFTHLQPRMTLARTIKLYALPANPTIPGFRALTPADVPHVRPILNDYLRQFEVSLVFTTDEEFGHWFLPRPDVIQSFVVENPETHEITDFVSYYVLSSSVLHNVQYPVITAAYGFYYFNKSVPLTVLMRNALIMAVKHCDVFNVLDLLHNREFFDDLHFGQGDGNLNYYLYNWKMPQIEPPRLGVVLV